MKKNTFFRRSLFFLLLFLGVCFYPEITERIQSIPSLSAIFSGNEVTRNLYDLLTGVPDEVREKKKRELDEYDPGHREYYFQQLDTGEKRAYREMLEGIRERRASFYLTTSGVDRVNRIAHALYLDHPELYWVHNREKSYTTSYQGRDFCEFAPGYQYTVDQMQEINNHMEAAFQEMCSYLPENPSEYEMVATVYTYIIDHTEYASSEDDQNIAGVFWKKEAVCAGYARAAMYLLERLGISCIFVEGNALDEEDTERHAWNIVTIDQEPYYMDTTNGDQPDFLMGEAAQLLEHKTTVMDYLCPFPEEYEQLYLSDMEFDLPVCTSHEMNFYVKNGSYITPYSWQAVQDICQLRIDNGAAVVRFKVGPAEDFSAAKEEWINGESSRLVSQYYMQRNGMGYVEYYCGTLDTFKTFYFIF